MKKKLIGLMGFLLFLGSQNSQAQMYNSGIGLNIDFGSGVTLAGAQYKHFFSGSNAVNAQVLFGGKSTLIGADYTFNQSINSIDGLGWYVGGGAQLTFGDGGTWLALRPTLGLEYTLPSTPIGLHFDWKPWWNLSNESNLEMGRFSIGAKYILN